MQIACQVGPCGVMCVWCVVSVEDFTVDLSVCRSAVHVRPPVSAAPHRSRSRAILAVAERRVTPASAAPVSAPPPAPPTTAKITEPRTATGQRCRTKRLRVDLSLFVSVESCVVSLLAVEGLAADAVEERRRLVVPALHVTHMRVVGRCLFDGVFVEFEVGIFKIEFALASHLLLDGSVGLGRQLTNHSAGRVGLVVGVAATTVVGTATSVSAARSSAHGWPPAAIAPVAPTTTTTTAVGEITATTTS
mmetsp:Transcript_20904/g.59627  ORF Transcript_20904/g.59627 Transcript_20904/m.59627 type:complete len:248 (-) Transcript_20904:894-1637(-)